jgi:hypothetical protein
MLASRYTALAAAVAVCCRNDIQITPVSPAYADQADAVPSLSCRLDDESTTVATCENAIKVYTHRMHEILAQRSRELNPPAYAHFTKMREEMEASIKSCYDIIAILLTKGRRESGSHRADGASTYVWPGAHLQAPGGLNSDAKWAGSIAIGQPGFSQDCPGCCAGFESITEVSPTVTVPSVGVPNGQPCPSGQPIYDALLFEKKKQKLLPFGAAHG